VLVVGDLDLFGLNPITGDILWQFVPSEGQYPGYSSLTAVGSVIFAASTSGHLYAVDAVTGTQRWAKQFNAETPTQVFNPTVAGGVVYAGFTYRPAIGPHQGGAVAIDTAGNLLWKTFTPRATASTHTEVTYGVAVTANEVVVGDNIGAYFLNKTTGAVQKSLTSTDFAETANADHRPVAAGDLVIIGTSLGNVVAFDATTHGRRWYRALGASVRSLAVDHSNVYLALLTGPFYILRWADGSVVWALDPGIGNAREDYLRAPSIDGDVLYLAGTRSVRALKLR
jgi:glucose dehydrogenase